MSITILNDNKVSFIISGKDPDMVHYLDEADILVGHNILSFDLPVLEKLYKWKPKPNQIIRDTLVCTRLIWPDIKNPEGYKSKVGHGSHSLAAWGHRLGILKGDFGKTTDWSQWSQEMQNYCEQDVAVTTALWNHILKQNYSEEAIQLEHDLIPIIRQQEFNGFGFDKDNAENLYVTLQAEKKELEFELKKVFGVWYENKGEFLPKQTRNGYTKGCPLTKTELIE